MVNFTALEIRFSIKMRNCASARKRGVTSFGTDVLNRMSLWRRSPRAEEIKEENTAFMSVGAYSKVKVPESRRDRYRMLLIRVIRRLLFCSMIGASVLISSSSVLVDRMEENPTMAFKGVRIS